MKKLVTAFALCAAMSAMAQSVESENIVGYSSTTLTNEFNMIGVNFEAIGGGQADLNKMITPTGLVGVDWAGTGDPKDQLLVWDPDAQGYPVFYSWTGADAESSGGCEAGTNNKWVNLGAWNGDLAGLPVINVPVGGAAWIQRASAVGAASVTFAGQVNTNSATLELKAGFNMFANAMPVVVDMNNSAKVTFTGLDGVDWAGTGDPKDQLLVWDPAAQGYPVFYSWTGADAESSGGCEAGTNNKWVNLGAWNGDVAGLPVINLPVGGASWIQRTTTILPTPSASINISGL
jgi:hypothetical protein